MPRFLAVVVWLTSAVAAAVPVTVTPVTAKSGLVVAGHPQAAEAGRAVLQAGGNAIDAAVAVSTALGVAEPYGSGLGGKIVLIYHEAATGKSFAVEALDQASGSATAEQFRALTREQRRAGWTSVCVPGLPAGLWLAHEKWGRRPWAENLLPAVKLARTGTRVLPKTQDQIEEQEVKIRAGDADLQRIYLPGGKVPAEGALLVNEDLARSLERFAAEGPDAIYRGAIADAIVAGARAGGGFITKADLAAYRPRLDDPVSATVFGHRIVGAPAPTTGLALYLTILQAVETEKWSDGRLRTVANLHRIGKVWQAVQPLIASQIGDVPAANASQHQLRTPESIAEIRRKAGLTPRSAMWSPPTHHTAAWDLPVTDFAGEAANSTTHFSIADAQGNVVSATQSTSLHFGAAVIAPGTGIVMNNTMSNFSYPGTRSVNAPAPGKRPRSTISPTIVLRENRPVLAIGLPGADRIPTAMLQVLLDYLAFKRPLAEAIGDTRVHLDSPSTLTAATNLWEVEDSFSDADAAALTALGWDVKKFEPVGKGRHFGGVNAIEVAADGTLTGYADPRRTNAAAGY